MGRRGPRPKERVLTQLHLDILHHVGEGDSNREIASRLGLTAFIVAENLQETFRLIGARNRTHAVAIGNRDGLICLPPLTDVEATGECCCAGCIGMGPCDDGPSSSDVQDDLAPDLEDFGCCELDDARGSGHDGPCAHICSHCNGSGECPACDGTGDDGSGLDYTCTECGGGSCPRCEEGMVTDA